MKRFTVFVALMVVAGFLILSATQMREFGSPAVSDMDDYIIDFAQEESAANNVVTAVVFDYRGFDTLGEATVLFTAVIGVSVVFRRLKK